MCRIMTTSLNFKDDCYVKCNTHNCEIVQSLYNVEILQIVNQTEMNLDYVTSGHEPRMNNVQ